MRIQELDPSKQYAVVIENDYVTQADLNAIKAKLTENQVNAVVLAGGATIHEPQQYWGVWVEYNEDTWPSTGDWLRDQRGNLYFYPAKAIAEAHAESQKSAHGSASLYRKCEAREFVAAE